jgi:hypothetical protein
MALLATKKSLVVLLEIAGEFDYSAAKLKKKRNCKIIYVNISKFNSLGFVTVAISRNFTN